MLIADTRSLLQKLNPTCTRALQSALGACVSGQHYEVTIPHVIVALLDDKESDLPRILEHYRVDVAVVRNLFARVIADYRKGNAGKPTLGNDFLELVQDAWLYSSTEANETAVRSGALLVRLLTAPSRYVAFDLPQHEAIPRDELRKRLGDIASASGEAAQIAAGVGAAAGGSTEPRKSGAVGAGSMPIGRASPWMTRSGVPSSISRCRPGWP